MWGDMILGLPSLRFCLVERMEKWKMLTIEKWDYRNYCVFLVEMIEKWKDRVNFYYTLIIKSIRIKKWG